LADQYLLDELKVCCTRHLEAHIKVDTVILLLRASLSACSSVLEQACLAFAVAHQADLLKHVTFLQCTSVDTVRKITIAMGATLRSAKRQCIEGR